LLHDAPTLMKVNVADALSFHCGIMILSHQYNPSELSSEMWIQFKSNHW